MTDLVLDYLIKFFVNGIAPPVLFRVQPGDFLLIPTVVILNLLPVPKDGLVFIENVICPDFAYTIRNNGNLFQCFLLELNINPLSWVHMFILLRKIKTCSPAARLSAIYAP